MNKLTQQIIGQLVNKLYPSKLGRKNKFTIEHYIETLGYVLKTGIAWRDLHAPLHWTTYYKKFKLWADHGIFKTAHSIILSLAKKKEKIQKQDLKTLFIDSSMIKNFKGCDLLGKNHYDRNRLGNKITLLITSNGIPLSISLTSANSNDQTEVIPTLNNCSIPLNNTVLVADGAYVSEQLRNKLRQQKIKFIFPYKKNQHKSNNRKELTLLGKRYLVENVFSWIQNYRRVRVRYEKDSKSFIQFYYFALVELIAVKLKK